VAYINRNVTASDSTNDADRELFAFSIHEEVLPNTCYMIPCNSLCGQSVIDVFWLYLCVFNIPSTLISSFFTARGIQCMLARYICGNSVRRSVRPSVT